MRKLWLLLLIPILLCGCAKKEAMLECTTENRSCLEITSRVWSGWDGGSISEEISKSYEISEGDEIVPEDYLIPLVFTVTSITAEELRIHCDMDLSVVDENGKYSMVQTQSEFTIPYGETIELATPSFDMVCFYKLTYVINEE